MSVDALTALSPQALTSAHEGKALQGLFHDMAVAVQQIEHNALTEAWKQSCATRDNSRQIRLAFRQQKTTQRLRKKLKDRLSTLCDLLPEKERQQPQQTIQLFLSCPALFTPQSLVEKLSNQSSSKSMTAAVLQRALDQQESLPLPQQKGTAVLSSCLDSLFDSDSVEICACLNALEALPETSFASAVELSVSYSALVCANDSALHFLQHLQQHYGEDHIEESLTLMFKALSHDFAAAQFSSSVLNLTAVSKTLNQSKFVFTALQEIQQSFTYIKDKLHTDVTTTAPALLEKILTASTLPMISAYDVNTLYSKEIVCVDPEQDVLIAQEFLSLFRRFSEQIFSDDVDKLHLVAAAQLLVNEKIESEEEWLSMLEEGEDEA